MGIIADPSRWQDVLEAVRRATRGDHIRGIRLDVWNYSAEDEATKHDKSGPRRAVVSSSDDTDSSSDGLESVSDSDTSVPMAKKRPSARALAVGKTILKRPSANAAGTARKRPAANVSAAGPQNRPTQYDKSLGRRASKRSQDSEAAVGQCQCQNHCATTAEEAWRQRSKVSCSLLLACACLGILRPAH